MKCTELHELIAAYALGALDEAEGLAVEQHLAEAGPHEGCHEALERARRVVLGLAVTVDPTVVPEAVWGRVVAGLEREGTKAPTPELATVTRLEPGRRAAPAPSPREGRVREGVAWTLVAAAAVALWVQKGHEQQLLRSHAVTLTTLANEREALDRQGHACALELETLRNDKLTDPDIASFLASGAPKAIALAPLPGKTVQPKAFVSADKTRVLVVVDEALADGRDYQLWLIRDKEPPVPAPLLRITPKGHTLGVASLETPRKPFDTLGLSIEPKGGSESPTEVVAVAKLGG